MARQQSWMSAFACCTPGSEHVVEQPFIAPIDGFAFEQPQLIAQPAYQSSAPRSTAGHTFKPHQRVTSSNTRPSTVQRPWTSSSHKRLKIGQPTDFRRIDEMPKRRHSFNPIELRIHSTPACKLSPLPDFAMVNWSMPTCLKKPDAVVLAGETQPQNPAHLHGDAIRPRHDSSVPEKPLSIARASNSMHRRYDSYHSVSPDDLDEGLMCMPVYKQRSGPDAIPSTVVMEPSPAAIRPRSNRALSRASSSTTSSCFQTPTTRSRSATESSARMTSMRRVKDDVEEAIRELNTIVEERRLDSMRATTQASATKNERGVGQVSPLDSPNDHLYARSSRTRLSSPHIPAIVPTMKVHARSETLSDIGSAFSTPHTGKSLRAYPNTGPPLKALSTKSSISSVGCREATIDVASLSGKPGATLSSPVSPLSATSARSRISSWLRRSVTSVSTSSGIEVDETTTSALVKQDLQCQFYRCESGTGPHRLRHVGSSLTTSSLNSTLHEDVASESSSTWLDSPPSQQPNLFSQSHSPNGGKPPATEVPFATHLEKRAGKVTITARKRGLSLGTVNGVPPLPPAYEKLDPHPNCTTFDGQRMVGLAY